MSPGWKKIGFFGGTFDPPHCGHASLAKNAYEQAGLDVLLWVVTPLSPFKNFTFATLDQRIEMLHLMIAQQPFSQLSLVEADRQPPYYTLDTAKLLRNQLTACDELYFILGGDSLRYFPKWHGAAELIHKVLSGLIVARRPGDDLDLERTESALPGISEKIHFIEMQGLIIASSEIRTKIQRGQSVQEDLVPDVLNYIHQNHLYQNAHEQQKESTHND